MEAGRSVFNEWWCVRRQGQIPVECETVQEVNEVLPDLPDAEVFHIWTTSEPVPVKDGRIG